ncbi:MAG: CehA/McbA family metallohydrolase [Trueperaceae bacterium]|nr:CehA/McbA family metallohydrolase [Trueperaceae bacterium]
MSIIKKSGTFHREDQQDNPYVYVPFEVPRQSQQIEVRLKFDIGNVIDLGLADPRFTDFPAMEGFRGWSGGFRDRFVIRENSATPGYIPGPLYEGTWWVLLGLYRISAEGCKYQIEILIDEETELTHLPLPATKDEIQLSLEPGWYPGDLHSHTYHSDAWGSLEDLLAAAESRGLSFLAVTDHNTTSHHPYLKAVSSPLLLIAGMELTTDFGHMNVFGAKDWIDFRFQCFEDIMAAVTCAHALGGVCSVNHPKEGGPRWQFAFPEVSCMEVWQAPWANRNWESLDWYQQLLTKGKRITLIGGSDRHQPGWPDRGPEALQIGSPTTWLYLEDASLSSVLKALQNGWASVSESPQGPFLNLCYGSSKMGETVEHRPGVSVEARVNGAKGNMLSWWTNKGLLFTQPLESDTCCITFDLEGSETFIRAEVWAQGEPLTRRLEQVATFINAGLAPEGLRLEQIKAHPYRLALSNPIYFKS